MFSDSSFIIVTYSLLVLLLLLSILLVFLLPSHHHHHCGYCLCVFTIVATHFYPQCIYIMIFFSFFISPFCTYIFIFCHFFFHLLLRVLSFHILQEVVGVVYNIAIVDGHSIITITCLYPIPIDMIDIISEAHL